VNQRDFFDRGVQSNVSQAVNQYYSYQAQAKQQQQQQQSRTQQPQSQSQARSTFTSRQSQNRWASSMSQSSQQQPQSQSNRRSTGQQQPQTQDSRMMRGGGGYANTNRSTMNGNGNNGRMNQNQYQNQYQSQTQNRWSSQSQSPNSGYGNGGPPNRYGSSYGARNSRNSNPRDRDSGQYTPTRYGVSSLEDEMKRNDEAKSKEPEKEEKMSAAELEAIRSQFLTLMEKNIKVNTERREKEKAESVLEEDTKKDDESAATESVSGSGSGLGSGSEKCVVINGNGKNGKGKGNYGSYGTTFDRHNVCWEFNTFVGCRKGSACKWAHQYLAKESAHPYTGEKLNGMAVRRFRKSNNI